MNSRSFGELLCYPLRSGVTVAAATRGKGIKMLNMGELFAHARIPDVTMARVELGTRDSERYLLEAGDLMFARRSLTVEGAGNCSIMLEVDEPTTWESSIIRARMNRSVADPRFYFYFFRSSIGRRAIENIVEQVAAAGIRLSELAKLEVPCPDLWTQQATAEVLEALDDKIAANTALARTADELATAQFADALHKAEPIPPTSLARFVNGGPFTKGATGSGRVVIRIAELNSGIRGSTVYNELEVADDHVARPGDLLFAWSGSLTLHRWYRDEGIVNQHIFKVIPVAGVPLWAVHQVLARKLAEFRAIAADKATTMGHIQRRHLEEPVPLPVNEEIARLDTLMTALWDRALAAEMESLTLARVRDALLPEFMSGRLCVRDSERQVEAVV